MDGLPFGIPYGEALETDEEGRKEMPEDLNRKMGVSMLYMNIDTDRNCVPCLSGDHIDDFCSDLISRVEPSAISRLHPVNIELLVKRFMGLKIRYEYLSPDGSVLGAAMFTDTDRFPIYDAVKRRTVYTAAAKGTVFIDKSLVSADKNNRYRYTLAHEAGHMLWHGMYFNVRMKENRRTAPYLMCTTADVASSRSLHKHEKLSSAELIERQANRTASALLMPKESLKKFITPMGECMNRSEAEDRILFTASMFRVSSAAARVRLCELGYIDAGTLKGACRYRHSS